MDKRKVVLVYYNSTSFGLRNSKATQCHDIVSQCHVLNHNVIDQSKMLNMPHAVGVDEPQATSRRLLAQVTVVMRVDLRYRAPRLVRI